MNNLFDKDWTENQDQELKDFHECNWENPCTMCDEYTECCNEKTEPLKVIVELGHSVEGFTNFKPYTVLACAGEYIKLIDDNGVECTMFETNFVPVPRNYAN